MKKPLLFVYSVLSLSIILTAVSWFTWGSSCRYTFLIPEGSRYSGMCAGDGMQFIGIFGFSVLIAIIYLALMILVFKALGVKLTKK
jgi:hypothetical protein